MLSAYVLIQAEAGKAQQVVQAIRGIDGVQYVDGVVGPYDLVARVQAPSIDDLAQLVVRHIHNVGGVDRTLICSIIHR